MGSRSHPLHAQPRPTRQVFDASMHVSPHALPLLHTLQQAPVVALASPSLHAARGGRAGTHEEREQQPCAASGRA